MLTVGLLAVVVYLYTVVAFNFFRKFLITAFINILTTPQQWQFVEGHSSFYEYYSNLESLTVDSFHSISLELVIPLGFFLLQGIMATYSFPPFFRGWFSVLICLQLWLAENGTYIEWLSALNTHCINCHEHHASRTKEAKLVGPSMKSGFGMQCCIWDESGFLLYP